MLICICGDVGDKLLSSQRQETLSDGSWQIHNVDVGMRCSQVLTGEHPDSQSRRVGGNNPLLHRVSLYHNAIESTFLMRSKGHTNGS